MLVGVSEDVKQEVVIFGQQLIVALNILKYYNDVYNKYKSECLPSIDKLKELGVTADELVKYLNTIKNDEQFSYSFMLNYYGNPLFRYGVTSKEKCMEYVNKMVKEIY